MWEWSWLDQISTERILAALSLLWTALGFLFSIGLLKGLWEFIKWRKDAQKENEQTRNQAYTKMEERYLRFLELSLQYPNLGVNLAQPDATNLSDEDRAKRYILYEMLFSVMERAYLDRTASREILTYQWPGWHQYIHNYLARPSCLDAWRQGGADMEVGYGLDLRFQKYMDEIAAEVTRRSDAVITAPPT